MKQAPLSVLLVDDAPLIRQRLKAMIIQLPVVQLVLEAGDYEEAIVLIRQHRPQCLVLDIRLPGKSGLEVLRTIAKTGYAMKILVLTNETEAHYKRLSLQLGACAFLDKSTDFDKVPDLLISFATSPDDPLS